MKWIVLISAAYFSFIFALGSAFTFLSNLGKSFSTSRHAIQSDDNDHIPSSGREGCHDATSFIVQNATDGSGSFVIAQDMESYSGEPGFHEQSKVLRKRQQQQRQVAMNPMIYPVLEEPPLENLSLSYNVVLTHTTADFDSLASAVGLAKLWRKEDPWTDCFVVLPRGSHPGVAEFLSLHMNMFPIRSASSLDPEMAKKVGVVDAQRRDRLGKAGQKFVDCAEEITVIDHHMTKNTDLNATNFILDNVGSVTTLVTEMLMKDNSIVLMDAEATLLALGIHADTGSLTYDSATDRDARCLAWLMANGANQQVISEYSHLSLAPEQQFFLMEAFKNFNQTMHNGAIIGSVVLHGSQYVSGMSRVAQNLLDLTNTDVVLFGLVYKNKPSKPFNHMVIIGRARSRLTQEVDLNMLLQPLKGGGHAKASAASVKLDDPNLPVPFLNSTGHEIMGQLVGTLIKDQMTVQEITAEDLMSTPVLACKAWSTIESVYQTIIRYQIRGLPVVSKDDEVKGYISEEIVAKGVREGQGHLKVSAKLRPKVPSVEVDTPLHTVETTLLQTESGCVTVEQQGKLVGMISRTDLLRHHHFYEKVPDKRQFQIREEAYGTKIEQDTNSIESRNSTLEEFELDGETNTKFSERYSALDCIYIDMLG
mmetsp:Transcript_21287/g.27511  ORF Transcript_21287/g.27511 Transcript_21287/m.27511 type:complete len:649 (-) Transcript_21287:192-2138(-)